MKAVNLIPGEQRQGSGSLTGRSGGAALILLGVVAGLAVLILMYGSASHRISSQKGEVATLTAEASAIQARAGRLTPYTNFVSMADQRTQTVAQLVQARFDWSHALHELGRVLPAGTSLATLHGQVGAAGQTSASSSAPATGDSRFKHSPREHSGVHAHGLRRQPVRGRPEPSALALDERRQRSAIAELHQAGRGQRKLRWGLGRRKLPRQ